MMAKPVPTTPSVPRFRQIIARFWPQIRKQRVIIFGSVLAMIAEIGFRLLEPWPLKFIFDRIIVVDPTAAPATTGWKSWDPMVLLTICAVAIVLIVSGRAMSRYLNRVGFAIAGTRVLTECRRELFSHLQRLSLSFHDRSRTGDLITRVTGDIGRLKEVAVTAALPLAVHSISLIGMIVIMLFMNWRLSLIALAIMPVFLFSTQRIGGKIRTVARKQRQREGEIGATTAEAIGSIKTVQSLSLEGEHERMFSAQNQSSLKEGVQGKRLSARLVGTVDVLVAIATALALWFGARLVIKGEMTPGDLIVFLAYLKSAFKPTRDLAKYAGRIAKGTASAERIVEILETTPLIRNRHGAIEAPKAISEVVFDNVAFGYDPDHLVIHNVTLKATTGQVIALAGGSGAGKSTVLNLVLRLYDPTSGSITFNGTDIREFTIESLRQRIAVVPQENVLFAVSTRDNISYGVADATEEQIIAAAKIARAHEFIEHMPQGYDTVLGERGATVSEGQRQRIAIARAAIRRAPVLVLDEATSSLDQENKALVNAAVDELSKDRITFIIAHDLAAVRYANVILFLENGCVVEQGTHDELLQQGGKYAAMFAMQQSQAQLGSEGRHAVST